MLGPIFYRQSAVAPKRLSTYVGRSIYVGGLFLLLCTGYLVLDGSRSLTTTGASARFSGWMFTLLAPLQLLILAALAAVGAASSVAQEKDRRTLLLLLMTRLSGFEVVVGKLAATLLAPLSLLLCALPLFLTLPLLGGVSPQQVLTVTLVTAATMLLAGSVGVVIGLWREKTFQAIALTVLVLLLYVGLGELVAQWAATRSEALALASSPHRALLAAASPLASLSGPTSRGVAGFVGLTLLGSAAVLGVGIAGVRKWNPSREVRFPTAGEAEASGVRPTAGAAGRPSPDGALAQHPPGAVNTERPGGAVNTERPGGAWKVRQPRRVWHNPVLWREVRTWAYGRKIVAIRLVFALFFALIAAVVVVQVRSGVALEPAARVGRALPAATLPLAALGTLSLVLLNALAVNSITGERDGLALDLLLVTDLTPREFVFGKLMGVLYVGKELILLPLLLLVYLATQQVITVENTIYAMLGGLLLFLFVTTLGIHTGLSYAASRTATLASLGTVFFLCVGIAVCMTIMVSFRNAFQLQLAPFLVMILGGGAALFASLGWRNPSSAIFLASVTLPLITFYAITQFLLQTDHLYVFFAVAAGYVFTTAAMLIPALSEFDVSLERDRDRSGDEA